MTLESLCDDRLDVTLLVLQSVQLCMRVVTSAGSENDRSIESHPVKLGRRAFLSLEQSLAIFEDAKHARYGAVLLAAVDKSSAWLATADVALDTGSIKL